MGRFFIRRGLRTLVVLFLVSILAFLALRLTPGDPALLLMGPQAGRAGNAERLENLREEMGLNDPLPVQYGIWVGSMVRGDFGESNRSGQEVLPLVMSKVPATAFLIAASVAIALPISIVIGIAAARRPDGLVDRLVRGTTTLLLAIPGFWLGIVLLIVFAVNLGWLPARGFVPPNEGFGEFLRHLALPSITLAAFLVGIFTRFVYTETADVLGEDHVRTTRAMGMPERRVLFKYAARNSLLPLVTVVGVELGALIGGAVLVEQVFGWSGVGQLMLQAVFDRDYQIVQGAVILVTVAVLFFNLITDVAYRVMDPRIKLQ